MSKKVTGKVEWVLAEESVLQVEGHEDHFNVSDKVLKFIESKGLDTDNGFEADLELDGDTVVKLSVKDGKKAEPKEEKVEKKEEVSVDEPQETKTVTDVISGVSVKNRGVKLLEDKDNKKWYTVSDEIDIEAVKSCQKMEVEIKFVPQDKGNDLIVDFNVVAGKTEVDTNVTKTNNSFVKTQTSSTQSSIESQVAVEHAQILSASMVTAGVLKSVEDVNKFVNERAKTNYNLMQNFKNGE